MKQYLPILSLLIASSVHAAEYHVAVSGNDAAAGSSQQPFQTIQKAADLAQPGDVITVHAGIYRERVNPPRGGTSDDNRIVYRAAPGEAVVIKGSEQVTDWKHIEDDVWGLRLPNDAFGEFNPFNDLLKGAWYEAKQAYHTGAVYINGHWLKEASSKDHVVTSLAEDRAEGEAAELMNIQSFTVGVGGSHAFDNYTEVSDGIEVVRADAGKDYLGRMTDGSYVAYKMDFGEESKFMSMLAASPVAGGIIEIRKGSVDGEKIGYFDIGFTAEWTHFQRFHANLTPMSGVQTIYCVFNARPAPIVDPTKGVGAWFAEVDDEHTTIWADFKGKDPTKEFIEINARKTVFYPEQPGIDYITVRGFTLEQAAPGWASATAEQFGLIGTHWSKSWVIEDNTIRYSVGTGVTLGKFGDEHNETYNYRGLTIPGAVDNGWDQIGHHLVKNNYIAHCAKNGIHSSLGAPFSTIVGNEIHDITINHQLGGCDTAGIKILGGVDVIIRDNHIYNCAHWGGIWLDWMAQGARVSGNLLHDNSQDLMFEVNHGPHLVDNNLLLSGRHITDASGGGAFVHNLWYGSINIWPDLKVRHTPYFKPHSLEIIDSIDVDQNDDRFYNNVFVGAKGTAAYDGHGIDITARGNVFLNGAIPSKHEVAPVQQADFNPGIKISKEADGSWWLEMEVAPADGQRDIITTEILGKARIPDARFEQRDGSPYRVDTDYFGQQRAGANPVAGPFNASQSGKIRLKVWPKK